MAKQKIGKNNLIRAIDKSHGIILLIQKHLYKITKKKYSRHMIEVSIDHHNLQQLIDEEKANVYDTAEVYLTNDLANKKQWAIKEVLRSREKALDRQSDADNKTEFNITISNSEKNL